MADLLTLENGVALVTLTAMEIVLGIDNIVFISILCGRLPESQRPRARFVGLAVAMVSRILLLLSIAWIMGLTRVLFEIPAVLGMDAPHGVTGKDLVLVLGGLFLIYKATTEIHHKVAGHESGAGEQPSDQRRLGAASFRGVIVQILLIDVVFSLDSVITAVGMAKHIAVMVTAVVCAVAVMMALAGSVSAFIERNPTVKMLALAFLMLIGVMLVADGVGQHLPRGYVYFAMAFSLGVEILNLKAGRRHAAAAAGR